jgi:hypothetical protein
MADGNSESMERGRRRGRGRERIPLLHLSFFFFFPFCQTDRQISIVQAKSTKQRTELRGVERAGLQDSMV